MKGSGHRPARPLSTRIDDGLAASNNEMETVKPQVAHDSSPMGQSGSSCSPKAVAVNSGCGTGHPSFVMSNLVPNQVLGQIELFTNGHGQRRSYVLPQAPR